jgi:hypothetical protein
MMTYIMAESAINTRIRPFVRREPTGGRRWLFALAMVLIAVGGVLAFDAYTGRLGIIGPRFEIVANGANRIIKVPPGGNVQAALMQANSGDIVELQAGAVYFGEIKLPVRPLTDYVTIRSSAAAELPDNKRVGPGNAASMAKILARGSAPSVSAGAGAHHYRFVGIEFSAADAAHNYNLILLGDGETRPADVPHDLEIDRSYLHPFGSGVIRRAIALNSANTTISNSYIEGFAFEGEETQGICGWTGTRAVRIINNYVEGGAENIMFGGSDPNSAELVPSDIEIRGNYLNKPARWRDTAVVKTLFELKNARRVQFTGNTLTNNWKGSAFRITVRNQDGSAPFSTLEDVTIRDNVVSGAGEGINILGLDDSRPSQTMKRLVISNNVFLNIGGPGFEGRGYFIQIADGEDITVSNNTVFNTGNIVTFYGTPPRLFVFRDNITGHGAYGVQGLPDVRSAAAREMVRNNVFINDRRVDSGGYSFPSNNTIVNDARDIGFANAAANDYRLSSNSRFRGKGTNRQDVGSSLPPFEIPR